jgi:NitT/TauT family transport system substrate-binding protein
MGPLMTGQVDVITGWQTNTTALKPLGDQRHKDLRLWDNGVQLYALPYYATVDTIAKQGETLAGFIRGCAKGWEYVKNNKQEAVKLLIREYPNLVEKDELEAVDVMLAYVFNDATKKNGWGQMDMAVWESQIKLYDDLKEFRAGAPKLDNVATLEILNATKDARPKI